jgi:hypothetical protein
MARITDDLRCCFEGVLPSVIATCSRDGQPNVTYLSQVHYLDPTHVALSCQFFNKTRRNIAENPVACVELYDPLTFDAYRLRLRFERAETSGPLYERMKLRIDAIASHTGMTGIFRLLSADVYEVLELEKVEDFLLPPAALPPGTPAHLPEASPGFLTELRGLQLVSDRINRACDLDALLNATLSALEELFAFRHGMVLLPGDDPSRLVAIASRGYGEAGIGAEVRLGEGLIGTVAAQRRAIRLTGVDAELRYARTIRGRVTETGGGVAPEIPLPGLRDAQSQLALPLVVQDRLVGVLALESTNPLAFTEWDEAYLQIIANQIAIGIDRMQALEDDEISEPAAAPLAPAPGAGRKRTFCFYKNDDCVFVDGEYLVRNVPGKLLWKLLRCLQREGRVEFSNRELRLDPSLGLPPVKDNLESRLILLRKRLAEKCPEVKLVPRARGKFALEVCCGVELVEKESAAQ